MAIFEKKTWGKVILDDTEALKVIFESTHNVQGHTEYVIRVQRGPIPDKSWHVCKRYNDFMALHNNVIQSSGISINLPPKKLLGNMDREFIAQRQSALQVYINSVLMNPILASSLGVRSFLDPESYVLSLQEKAEQHVSMALRGEENYELLKNLSDIGWRLRKHYFLVRARLNPRTEMALSWVEYGPDKFLSEKDILTFYKLFTQPVHSNIQKFEFAHCTEAGSYIIRQFYSEGTLRDHICVTKPKTPFLKKYGSPKQLRPLPMADIALFGRQILDALVFLREKDIPYGHLHMGNILLVEGKVQLLDVENGILGLPSYYRPFFIQHRKINNLEAVDVYCLGHLLYEMALGVPLLESVCDNLPPSCSSSLRDVLDSILSTKSCRSRMPTFAELQQNPFFGNQRNDLHRPVLKMPSSLREALKSTCTAIEQRLRNEQKIVRNQKKIAKVQELMITDGENKKVKKRLKEAKSTNGNHPVVGKSPPRSESPTSTSTVTSAGTVTPPFQAAVKISTICEVPSDRSALLDSICAFNKKALRNRSTNGKLNN